MKFVNFPTLSGTFEKSQKVPLRTAHSLPKYPPPPGGFRLLREEKTKHTKTKLFRQDG